MEFTRLNDNTKMFYITSNIILTTRGIIVLTQYTWKPVPSRYSIRGGNWIALYAESDLTLDNLGSATGDYCSSKLSKKDEHRTSYITFL